MAYKIFPTPCYFALVYLVHTLKMAITIYQIYMYDKNIFYVKTLVTGKGMLFAALIK